MKELKKTIEGIDDTFVTLMRAFHLAIYFFAACFSVGVAIVLIFLFGILSLRLYWYIIGY